MTKHKLWIGVLALLVAVLCLSSQPAHAQTPDVTFDLCATTGTLNLPGGTAVPIWGYAPGDCSDNPSAGLPGPTLTVNAGDVVQINLHNNLAEDTALNIPVQALLPDVSGAAPGGTQSYTFAASEPGTYLYEAGLLAPHQVAMGMYGALIVNAATPGQAYNDASTAFDDEAVIILSEIDPALNNGVPSAFDLRQYAPKYFLLNGQVYPDVTDIATAPGNRVLLRYLNAGLEHHSLSLMGLSQRVVALDGSPLAHAYTVVAETMAPGQGIDVITTIPASAPDGSRFALYDASLMLNNRTAVGFGGMMTFLSLAGGGPGSGDTEGPIASGTAVTPSGSDVLVTATLDDSAKGGSNIQAAEYYLDSTSGTAVSMSASDSAFDSPTESVEGTITAATLASLSTGNHTIYVRGQDAAGNWGSFNLGVLHIDNQGPATSALTLTPNPSGGGVDVVLHGTSSDSATGGANVIQAEYFIDAPGADGTGTAVNIGGPGVTVNLMATIPAGLSEGIHPIYVHGQDSTGLWGAFATIDLKVDQTGPSTSGVTANPNPNNGSLPYSLSQPSVRINATISDGLNAGVQSNITAAEGFFDVQGADGTGFPLTPSDGLYNAPTENGYVFVPLTTIATLAEGTHTIYIHGKDASGNWGAAGTADLIIDKTGPTLSGISAAPNPTEGAASVTLSATASETVVQAEWFMGTDPGVGNGTPMNASGTSVTAVIDVTALDAGNYTLYLRAKDAAGNWSTVGSTSFLVSVPAIDFSTTGNTNPPGVGGTADDSDIYRWNGAYSRVIDVTTLGVPGSASVDGFHRVDDTHFYLSFSGGNTFVSGLGNVQDEDVIYYNAGTWSVFFNGTAWGLTGSNEDIDAFSVVGGVLYFSMVGNTFPADDADIYSWDGSTFAQVWDATANGLGGAANVDGLKFIDANHFYLSFNSTTTAVPGLGNVQDEDIVYYDNGTWSVYFDGTAFGLGTSGNLDIDAFDFP